MVRPPIGPSAQIRNRKQCEKGDDILRHQLVSAGIECLHQECYCENTGNVCYYCVKGNAVEIKKITVEIENNLSVGRLFDMDVLDENGTHIERMEIGESPRTCLLCGNPAKECARSRTHSVAELEQTTKELLLKEFQEQDSRRIAELACRSLLYEVCTTPKPGLVDRRNSGSHKDMDCFTFMSSAASLWPYFQKCAQMGMETAQEPPKETFRRLRWAGKIAGYDMNQATNGVNTHKGALFSIGILCGALGRLPREKWKNVKVVLGECAAMTKGIVEHDFREVTEENAGTTGEKLYVKYGITGIRGQAEKGVPAVMEAGLPALERGLKKGLSLEQAGCATLLALMVSTVDTNLIARSNRETQLQVTEEIKEILEKKTEFSALYATADTLAIGACRALKEAGLTGPDDISVAGFDGIDAGEYYIPSITTIRQPVEQLAAETAKMLFSLISGKEEPCSKVYDGELIVRESTKSRIAQQ